MLRRELFKKLASGLVGASLLLVPLGAGIIFVLDPLRRGALQRGFRRVASIDSLPFGIPRSFTVRGTRTDAWETTPDVPIGAVYLQGRRRVLFLGARGAHPGKRPRRRLSSLHRRAPNGISFPCISY